MLSALTSGLDDSTSSVGQRLRRLRMQRGLSQRALAAGIVSPATISLIERGKVTPSWPTLLSIAQALGVSVLQLVDPAHGSLARETVRRLRRAAEEALRRGEPVLAERALRDAEAAARETGDLRALAQVQIALARALRAQRRPVESLWASDEALGAFRQLGDARGVALAYRQIGLAHFDAEHFPHARIAFQKALSFAPAADPKQRAPLLRNLATALYREGRYDQAARTFQDCVGAAQAAGDRAVEAVAHWGYGAAARQLGDREGALRALERAMGLLPRDFDPVQRQQLAHDRACVLIDLGRAHEAAPILRRAIAFYRQRGEVGRIASAMEELARCHECAGDLRSARQLAADALRQLPAGAPFRLQRGRLLRLLGRLDRLLGHRREAENQLERSLDLFEMVGAAAEAQQSLAELACLARAEAR